VRDISIFIGAMYVGGLVMQYPIGWASDRMDRRTLILGCRRRAAAMFVPAAVVHAGFGLLVVSVMLGGIINPLYSLLIAHTNDFLRQRGHGRRLGRADLSERVGRDCGPLVTGWMMEQIGPGFFLFIGGAVRGAGGLRGWRMTRRAAPVEGRGSMRR
jgi:MFS family permease